MESEKKLFELFHRLGITTKTFEHEPLFTVEQAQAVAHNLPGAQCKNLFLKDSKQQLWLIVAHADSRIDLKTVARLFNAPELRFANADLLHTHLGVVPGAVTPFGLINDQEHRIIVLLDLILFDYDLVGFHPLRNSATTVLSPHALKKFIDACGNKVHVVDFYDHIPPHERHMHEGRSKKGCC